MKKDDKSKTNRKKQLISAGLYIALTAAVVGITSTGISSILSGGSGYEAPDFKIPESSGDIGYDSELVLPEIPKVENNSSEMRPEAPVAGVKEGVSAETKEVETVKAPENTEETETMGTAKGQTAEETSGIEYPTEPEDSIIVNSIYVKPADGYISREYSMTELLYTPTMNDFRTHSGIDISGDIGGEVRAFCDGEITKVYTDDLMGMTVVIQHADGICSYYQNLSEALPKNVVVGAKVKAGETIGGIGQTAMVESAEVPHVHFELRANDTPVDPTLYLR